MRAMQFIGLSPTAEEYLEEYGVPVSRHRHTCSHCRKPFTVTGLPIRYRSERYVTGYGEERRYMFNYPLKTEQLAREVLQLREDYCGLMYFTCLVVDGQRIGEWTEEELAIHFAGSPVVPQSEFGEEEGQEDEPNEDTDEIS